MFARFSPALWEEIGGLADALSIAMERAVVCFGNNGLRPPTGGCSAIMSAGIYGRNYDYRPRYYAARFALVQAKGSYTSVGASGLLTGRLDGMNERGLVIGLHLVRMSPRAAGLSCVLIVRILLAAGRQRRCSGRGGGAWQRRGAHGRLARLHQSFSVAAASAVQSPSGSFATEIACS